VTAAVVTSAAQLIVTVRVADGHHVVSGTAGPGRRVGRRRVGRPGTRRSGRVQVRHRRGHRLVVNYRLLLLVTPDRREPGPVVLLVTVGRRRRQQQLVLQVAWPVGGRHGRVRKRWHHFVQETKTIIRDAFLVRLLVV